MKKRIGILLTMAILIGIPFAAKAAEDESSGTDEKAVKSYGTIIYEDKDGSVRIYAEDIALLQEKLASIPDEIFDPVLYSHIHVWEYIDVTDQGHTKHCDICGSKYDVTNAHNEAAEKECTITFNGHDYPGYEKTCECGYTWKMENGHSLIYTSKDEDYHTQSCALDGTSYCIGIEKVDLPHIIKLYPTDQTHHQKGCSECEYQGDIEECVFEIEEDEKESSVLFSLLREETGSSPDKPEEGTVKKYCACGNFITEPKTNIANLDVTGSEGLEISESVSGNDCLESDMKNETDEAMTGEKEKRECDQVSEWEGG